MDGRARDFGSDALSQKGRNRREAMGADDLWALKMRCACGTKSEMHARISLCAAHAYLN